MLVLASASPRRKELLTQAGYAFRVMPADIPEIREPGEEPVAFVSRLAREKAQHVFEQISEQLRGKRSAEELLVLGADTVVVVDDEVLGKPADPGDAERMLGLLSAQTHQVITGVALLSPGQTEIAAEITQVTMKEISLDERRAYIATGEPMDKAGAYAIQGYAARWIPHIAGCYFNVVGLPVARVAGMVDSRKGRL